MGNLGYMTTPSDKIRDLEQKNYNLGIRNNRLVELLRDPRNNLEPVSYTHLTLPTTP